MTSPIVTVSAGRVQGVADAGVRRFLGLPYAAPPVGPLRFKPPQPCAHWRDVRDATRAGATPPQRVNALPGLDVTPLVGEGWIEGDDYLTLNVWAPDAEPDALGAGLPVMVFIHGGAWVLGHKDAAIHDGSGFARSGVLCVAINYRLGVEGFLPFPGCPTNLGLRDQIFALAWVRDNIRAFGGDPANVTVFGESAGAMSIGALVTSPLAEGLFRRAIIQSGHAGMTRSVEVMQRLVARMARLMNVTPDLAGFASASPRQALDALDIVSRPTTRIDLRDGEGREPAFGLSRFLPVHGDDVLPVPPLEGLKRGAGRDVEVLIGTNAEEMNLYFVPTGVKTKIGRLLAWFLLRRVQPGAGALLRAYGMGRGVKPGEAFTRALSDLVFRWPARRFAEEHCGRTHVYDLSWRSPACGGELGACHGIELPFVFDTLAVATGAQGLCGTAPPRALVERMHRLWVGFARDGSLPWRPFDRDGRTVYDPFTDHAAAEAPMPAAAYLP